jgi:DNA mismatch repair protein MutS
LHTATEKSLVIMDEVGRGTGTNDGLSIAWAVSEELLNHIRCRTLFATHYHELARISHPRMANRSMEVAEKDGEIVFLRRLREGPAMESYGLHAARLAGLPERVLTRAAFILEELRRKEASLGQASPESPPIETATESGPPAPQVRDGENPILKELSSLDINEITPLEALGLLSNWKTRGASNAPPRKREAPKAPKGPSLFD